MKLTPEEYAAIGGTNCPMCGSEEFTGGSVTFDIGLCTQEMSCDVCNAVWYDEYTLMGYGLPL